MIHYQVFRDQEASDADHLVLIDIREAEIPQNSDLEQYLHQCIQKHNRVTLITANASRMHFDQYCAENFELINYPRSFFINYYNYNDPKEPLLPNSNFKYRFACFNNKAKSHRVQLIDQLYGLGEQHHSIITWRSGQEYLDLAGQPPKHFDTIDIVRTDLSNADHHGMTWKEIVTVPLNYDQCAVDLVTESIYNIPGAPDTVFVTEKTVKPLWHGKLFLTLAAPGFHGWLRSQGFELYDELFDYSFDRVHAPLLRFRGYFSNVKKLSAMSLDQIETVYHRLKDKITHNAELARTIDSNAVNLLLNNHIDRDFVERFSEQQKADLASVSPTYYQPDSDK